MATNATAAMPSPSLDTVVLESFIPGYSLASRLLATYFHLDLTFYLPIIVTCAACFAAIKYSFSWLTDLYEFLRNYFVCTAEISLEDEIYTYLMYWMSTQPTSTRATNFVASTKLRSGRYSYYDSDDEEDSDDEGTSTNANSDAISDLDDNEASFDEYWARTISRDRFKPLRFTPSHGTYYFRYKGRYVAFSREREDNKQALLTGGSSLWQPERLYLSCAGRDPTLIKDLLAEAQRAYVVRDGNRTVIYRGQKSGVDYFDWVRCMARSPRPLSTVVLDKPQKDAFVADIKDYLHPRTRRWYSNRGIPYRRGYLLHGPPGTGKTSLCFAASGLLGLTLYLLNLNSRSLDEDSLMSLFADLPRRCIVLLEDVDSAGITKKRAEDDDSKDSKAHSQTTLSPAATSPSTSTPAATTTTADGTTTAAEPEKSPTGLSLSALLNVIDGVTASEGRILVMTTNHAEKLDAALLRPGRVDMTVTFGYAGREDIKELFSAIYSTLEGDVRGGRAGGGSPATRGDRDSVNGEDAEVRKKEEKKKNEKMKRDSVEAVECLAEGFAARVPAGELTAAEIQGYLLNYKHAPRKAIERVGEWVGSVRRKREAQK